MWNAPADRVHCMCIHLIRFCLAFVLREKASSAPPFVLAAASAKQQQSSKQETNTSCEGVTWEWIDDRPPPTRPLPPLSPTEEARATGGCGCGEPAQQTAQRGRQRADDDNTGNTCDKTTPPPTDSLFDSTRRRHTTPLHACGARPIAAESQLGPTHQIRLLASARRSDSCQPTHNLLSSCV